MITAMGVMGRVRMGSWVGPVHRWSGRIAVAVSVPVAVHCLYALGFQTFDARVLLHSLFGCFFYGAFVAKMLILTRDDTPKWALPLAGRLRAERADGTLDDRRPVVLPQLLTERLDPALMDAVHPTVPTRRSPGVR